jgi:tetratricopeptide (TPR) repeat protein
MSKRIGITIILLLFLFVVSAQKKLSYIEADSKSFELYQQQKWIELIDFSVEARDQGIDFFYLQARTGIAYYNLKKYRNAADWFLKAWENDKSFEWLQEYLYYSLIYGGRSVEASKVADKFSVAFKQNIYYQKMKPTRAAVEIGYSFNPDFEQLSNTDFEEEIEVGNNYGEAYILKNYHFETFDYSHQIAPGVFLNHNFTHLGIDREEQVFWGSQYSFPIKVTQNQYFINPVFVLNKKWYGSVSINAIWGNSDLVLGNYNPNTFYSSNVKFSDFIFSTSTWTHWGNFSPGAEINLANIYNKGFTQLSGWITWYPLSNTNLYFTPRVYFKNDSENGFGYNTFGISGGVQLGQVHFYGQYLNGDMKNFIEPAGYVVANFPGRSEQKFTGSFYFPTGKRYQFVLRYINQNVFEKYQVYSGGIPGNSMEYDYTKHTLTGGISWNF